MVLVHHFGHRPREFDIFEDLVADGGVLFHQLVLGIGEFDRLHQDFEWHANLAHIMDGRGQLDAVLLVLRQADFLRDRQSQLADPPHMTRCVLIARFHHRGHSLDRFLEALFELLRRGQVHKRHFLGQRHLFKQLTLGHVGRDHAEHVVLPRHLEFANR